MWVGILFLHAWIFFNPFLPAISLFILIWCLFIPSDLLLQFPSLSLWRGVISHPVKQFSELFFGILQEITFGALLFLYIFRRMPSFLFFIGTLSNPYFCCYSGFGCTCFLLFTRLKSGNIDLIGPPLRQHG